LIIVSTDPFKFHTPESHSNPFVEFSELILNGSKRFVEVVRESSSNSGDFGNGFRLKGFFGLKDLRS